MEFDLIKFYYAARLNRQGFQSACARHQVRSDTSARGRKPCAPPHNNLVEAIWW